MAERARDGDLGDESADHPVTHGEDTDRDDGDEDLRGDDLDDDTDDTDGEHTDPVEGVGPTTTASRRPGRPSKWDRPRSPRDWRFVVGGTGRVLLAAGVLMFAFVAYQLWGTGIETARAQRSLEDQFEELVADDATTPTTTGAAATDPPTTPAPSPDTTLPASIPETTLPPTSTVPPTTEPPPPPAPIVRRGEVLAKLEIPRIDQELYVVPGVGPDDLKQGPGHYPDSPLPGQLGNAAIAGHRTTYGAPFFDVDQLDAGDELRVTLTTGEHYVYDVTDVEVVDATDYWVVTTQRPDIAELTLTSCHPKYSARQRIIVHSVLDEARSAPVGPPTFYDLDADPDHTPPGDDPALRAAETTAAETTADRAADPTTPTSPVTESSAEPAATGTTSPPTTAPEASSPSTSTTEPASGATATTPGAADDASGIGGDGPSDDFGRGWFHDDDAWPQIALWGTLLTAIAVGAWTLSRRLRRDWAGLVVGIAPFVVALYFFFQNVNRLLPPNL